jgi:hypothetical protein
MSGPKPPLRGYLSIRAGGNRYLRSEDAPPHDPQLPQLAWKFRRDHQLMSMSDFSSYNISVWRLEDSAGRVQYITRQNTTIGELAKKFGPVPDRSSDVGFHSELLIADEVLRMPGVRSQRTHVTQIFTERFPCRNCQSALGAYPQFQNVPFYYYLSYTDKSWQKQQANKNWGLFLLSCYGT